MHPHLAGWQAFANTGFSDRIFDFHSAAPVGWLTRNCTVLKVFISDLGYESALCCRLPIAQNGVVIMIGPYQLLMKMLALE